MARRPIQVVHVEATAIHRFAVLTPIGYLVGVFCFIIKDCFRGVFGKQQGEVILMDMFLFKLGVYIGAVFVVLAISIFLMMLLAAILLCLVGFPMFVVGIRKRKQEQVDESDEW